MTKLADNLAVLREQLTNPDQSLRRASGGNFVVVTMILVPVLYATFHRISSGFGAKTCPQRRPSAREDTRLCLNGN